MGNRTAPRQPYDGIIFVHEVSMPEYLSTRRS